MVYGVGVQADGPLGAYSLESGSTEERQERSLVKVKGNFRENLIFELSLKNRAGLSRHATRNRCLLLLPAQRPSCLL